MLSSTTFRTRARLIGSGLVMLVAAALVLLLAAGLTPPFVATGLNRIMIVVTTFLPYLIAVLALAVTALAVREYLRLHRRELALKGVENDVELAWLQGEMVATLRLRAAQAYSQDREEEHAVLIDQLELANNRYQAILEGILRARPDLAHTEREAISAYLDQAEAELQRMEQASAS
jgi:hypothetical protein